MDIKTRIWYVDQEFGHKYMPLKVHSHTLEIVDEHMNRRLVNRWSWDKDMKDGILKEAQDSVPVKPTE